MDAAQLAETFAEWNKGELDSYLIEITSQIFRKIDPETGKPLVDVILDKAGQKGTGIWTLAIRHQAIGRHFDNQRGRRSARYLVAQRRARCVRRKSCRNRRRESLTAIGRALINAVRDALYASKIVSYAQGMELLRCGKHANTSGT